jgi:hypothetical protein
MMTADTPATPDGVGAHAPPDAARPAAQHCTTTNSNAEGYVSAIAHGIAGAVDTVTGALGDVVAGADLETLTSPRQRSTCAGAVWSDEPDDEQRAAQQQASAIAGAAAPAGAAADAAAGVSAGGGAAPAAAGDGGCDAAQPGGSAGDATAAAVAAAAAPGAADASDDPWE